MYVVVACLDAMMSVWGVPVCGWLVVCSSLFSFEYSGIEFEYFPIQTLVDLEKKEKSVGLTGDRRG